MVELGDQYALTFLCALALADIPQDDRVNPARTNLELGHGGLSGEFLSSPPLPNHILPLAHAASDNQTQRKPLDMLTVNRAEPRRDQQLDGSPQHLAS